MGLGAAAGTRPTPRELQVLAAYARFGTYRATARHLGVSRTCVRDALANVRSRLGASSSIQAYRLAERSGLFCPQP